MPHDHDRQAAHDRVADAVAAHRPTLEWRYSACRPPRPIEMDDLVACYLTISRGSSVFIRVGIWQWHKKQRQRQRRRPGEPPRKVTKTINRWQKRDVGFSRERLGRLLSCPKEKATAMLRTLVALGLVEIVKNHSAGRHATVFAIVPTHREAKPRPQPMTPAPTATTVVVAADDDPFA